MTDEELAAIEQRNDERKTIPHFSCASGGLNERGFNRFIYDECDCGLKEIAADIDALLAEVKRLRERGR